MATHSDVFASCQTGRHLCVHFIKWISLRGETLLTASPFRRWLTLWMVPGGSSRERQGASREDAGLSVLASVASAASLTPAPGLCVGSLLQTSVPESLRILSSGAHGEKDSKEMRQRQFPSSSVVRWRRKWHRTPVLLPGKSHGWRSLVGCSTWGCWGLDTTEQLHFPLSCTEEGNGTPL